MAATAAEEPPFPSLSDDDGDVGADSADVFTFLVEGVLILVVGGFGLLGNSFSVVLFSRQKVHRIFHNLLLTLSLFDLVSRNPDDVFIRY